MINRPLFKCLLAALSVLSRVGGTRSWIAPLRDPLLRHWIVPVRNVSVEVQACARAGRLCPTLLLHDLARADDRALLTQPWMGHPAAASLGGFPLGGLRLEGAPFAPARCKAYVRGVHALFSARGTRDNFYVGNAGHLVINVLNPLLMALAHSTPAGLPTRLHWVRMAGTERRQGTPSVLFDAVVRLVGTTLELDEALKRVGAGGRLCFEFATLPLAGRAGSWDAMMYDHPGRWGPRQLYRGVWPANRARIAALYGLPGALPPPRFAAPGGGGAGPRGVWILRGGKSRSDASNAPAIRVAFGGEGGGLWLRPVDVSPRATDTAVPRAPPGAGADRSALGAGGARALDLLAMLQAADVLVGMFGAGLWNALFLRPGSLLVELKTTYGRAEYRHSLTHPCPVISLTSPGLA